MRSNRGRLELLGALCVGLTIACVLYHACARDDVRIQYYVWRLQDDGLRPQSVEESTRNPWEPMVDAAVEPSATMLKLADIGRPVVPYMIGLIEHGLSRAEASWILVRIYLEKNNFVLSPALTSQEPVSGLSFSLPEFRLLA